MFFFNVFLHLGLGHWIWIPALKKERFSAVCEQLIENSTSLLRLYGRRIQCSATVCDGKNSSRTFLLNMQ